MEEPVGVEPTNNSFANCRVKPLHHGSLQAYCLYQISPKKANILGIV